MYSDVSLYDDLAIMILDDLCPTPNSETRLEKEFQTFQEQIREDVLNYVITQADNNIQHQHGLIEACDIQDMKLLPPVDMKIQKSKIPTKTKALKEPTKCHLPVPVKETDETVAISVLVEVKTSRLPQAIRSLFHKFQKPGAKPTEKKTLKEDIQLHKKIGTAMQSGFKSRLPMPARMLYPPKKLKESQIPLAFSRFPNPAKVHKVTLARQVKKALTKQVAKINWTPKIKFPHLGEFFDRIRGSNKVVKINI